MGRFVKSILQGVGLDVFFSEKATSWFVAFASFNA